MVQVIHSVPVWLPQTQTWLHEQIRVLPPSVRSHVACDRTENLDQFAFERIHALQQRSAAAYVVEKALRKYYLPNLSSEILRLRRELPGALLHSHFGDHAWNNVWTARLSRLPHVVSFYGRDISWMPARGRVWKTRYQRLFAQVARVLCEGPHMASVAEQLGCPRHKLRVHRLGIDLDRIEFRPRSYRDGEPLKVLICAAFREKKGIPYALEALGRFRASSRIPLRVTIIGDSVGRFGTDEEKQRILTTLAASGLTDATSLLGFQPHARVTELAAQHHLYLAPSVTASDGDTEGGAPIALIEMAAAGMLVVSSRHCDIPEVVDHERSGWLAGERDVDGLVRGLHWLTSQPQRWSAIGQAARRRAEERFDSRAQAGDLAAIYEELAAASEATGMRSA